MGEEAERVGPYRVLRRLGVGGMAETFEALREHDRGVAQRVCIKRVLPAYASDTDTTRLFELESRTMAELSHGNIVGVVDVGTHEGTPYLVLELVDGIDLRALLVTAPSRRIDPDVARYLAYELAIALDYAHGPDEPRRMHGVVHRDISPSNVLVARGGEVRLTDFGLAKTIASHPVTQSGAVRGKIPYMAPEHMRGGAIDGRADLFSLGVLLFECLAGSRPFDGSHEVETMTRILAGTSADLQTLRPDLDPELVRVVSRLLESDRERRFPTARAVADALEALGPIRKGRRALARLVESRLGGMITRAHVSPHLYFSAPKTSVVADASTETAVTTAPEKRKRRASEERAEGTAPDAALHAVLDRTAPGAEPMRALAAEPTVLVARTRSRSTRQLAIGSVVSVAILGTVLAYSQTRRQTPIAQTRVTPRDTVAHEPASIVEAAPASASTAAPANNSVVTPVVHDVAPAAADEVVAAGESVLRIVVEPWGKVWVDGRLRGRAPRVVPLEPGSHLVEAGFDGPTHRRTIVVAQGETRVVRLDITPRE